MSMLQLTNLSCIRCITCIICLSAVYNMSHLPTLSEMQSELSWCDHCSITQGSPGVHGTGPSQGEGKARGQACVNSCALF